MDRDESQHEEGDSDANHDKERLVQRTDGHGQQVLRGDRSGVVILVEEAEIESVQVAFGGSQVVIIPSNGGYRSIVAVKFYQVQSSTFLKSTFTLFLFLIHENCFNFKSKFEIKPSE